MDTLSNVLTSLRNAELASRQTTMVPTTKATKSLLDVLQSHGYINSVAPVEGVNKLQVTLNQPIVRHHFKRVSKPSRRVYIGVDDIRSVRQGTGMLVVSTSKGVMTGSEARQNRVGGEVLCEVY